MLRLWGRLSSINVRKVVWAAQELGITVQRTDAGGQFGLVREADYLQRNPNGLVPLLEDDETSTPSCASCARGTLQASCTLKPCVSALWPSSGWTGSRPL